MIELKSALEKERFAPESTAESQTADETTLLDQYRRMEKARVALGTGRFRFFVKIRRIVGSRRFRQLLEPRK